MEWFAFYVNPALPKKKGGGINLLYTILIKNKSNTIKLFNAEDLATKTRTYLC